MRSRRNAHDARLTPMATTAMLTGYAGPGRMKTSKGVAAQTERT